MKKLIASLIISVLIVTSAYAQSPVSFVMNISPGSFLTSFNLNELEVVRGIPNSTSFQVDQISGNLSVTPYMALGLSINTTFMFIDFTAGGGFLYNNVFYGPTYNGDLAIRFRPSTVFTIGIHGGPYFGSFTWNHDGVSDKEDIKLGNLIGYNFGPTLTVGKSANFIFSVDYMIGTIDVNTYNGWRANQNDLDLSGLVFNFGFLLRVPYRDKF